METLHALLYGSPLTVATTVLRLLLTTLLCGSIGFERGYKGRAAGLRTHILVGVGACATVLTGLYAVGNLSLSSDPLRIAAQVVSGIGFLGVGTILVRGKTMVTGLTTAAGLWLTAAIGITVGIGFYAASLTCTVIALFTFALLTEFERSGRGSKTSAKIYIECADIDKLNALMKQLRDPVLCLFEFEITPARSGIPHHIGIEAILLLPPKRRKERSEVIDRISALDAVICAIESV